MERWPEFSRWKRASKMSEQLQDGAHTREASLPAPGLSSRACSMSALPLSFFPSHNQLCNLLASFTAPLSEGSE